MKDKLKGLVVGLLLGSLVTGTLAYAAAGRTINVTLPNLKLMFDGVEKQPPATTPAFEYKNTTYVPLRFLTEALGKDVNFDGAAGTVWIGKNYGGKANAAVAVYRGGTITQVELDTYLQFSSFYYGEQAAADTESAVKELIALELLSAKASAAHGKDADAAAAAELGRMKQYFGGDAGLTTQLAAHRLTQLDVTRSIKANYLAGQTLEAMVDDAAVKAEYDRRRAADAGAFVTASVRHILVATTDADTGETLRTDAEALARANEARQKLVAGGDFAELAKQYSDDDGSKESGGLYADAELEQFVEPFKLAAAELPLNTISEPVKTSYGYHVMKVESRTLKTADEVKDRLKQELIGPTYQQYLEKDVPKLIESLKLPEAGGS